MTLNRLPEYAALVTGSQEIRRLTGRVRHIDTEFALAPSTDREFLYEVLGGWITPDAAFTATIDRTGRVSWAPVPSDPGTGRRE
jgi:hypothetical protein